MSKSYLNKRGLGGHSLSVDDRHQICFTCRTAPKCKVRVVYQCQVDFITQQPGNEEGCVATPIEVKESWAPKRDYAGFKYYVYYSYLLVNSVFTKSPAFQAWYLFSGEKFRVQKLKLLLSTLKLTIHGLFD